MKQQTAVEWLTDYMKENFHLTDESLEKFEQAKQMEKEQIVEAFDCDGYREGETWISSGEQYYNETYGK